MSLSCYQNLRVLYHFTPPPRKATPANSAIALTVESSLLFRVVLCWFAFQRAALFRATVLAL
jgi:hypothetical protein